MGKQEGSRRANRDRGQDEPTRPRSRLELLSLISNWAITVVTAIGTLILWFTVGITQGQLETMRNQLSADHLDRMTDDWKNLEPARRTVVDLARSTKFLSADHFYREKHPEKARVIGEVGNFYESLGRKVSRGYVAFGDVNEMFGRWIVADWEMYRPAVYSLRGAFGEPKLYEYFEDLSGRCRKARQ